MPEQYSLSSIFDIEKHKATFVNYLEVVILHNGAVVYAVPSHQEMLIKLACLKTGMTRDQLKDACPREYYFDFTKWLCMMSGAVAVWNEHCEYGTPTVQQIAMLRKLKMAGLYRGAIPQKSENGGENI